MWSGQLGEGMLLWRSMPILSQSACELGGHLAHTQGDSTCFSMSCCCIMKHAEVREGERRQVQSRNSVLHTALERLTWPCL